MASICEVCGKGTLAGNNVSHSNRHTKRAWKPNIQQVRAIVNESVKRVNVCTRCLRSGKIKINQIPNGIWFIFILPVHRIPDKILQAN